LGFFLADWGGEEEFLKKANQGYDIQALGFASESDIVDNAAIRESQQKVIFFGVLIHLTTLDC
jgi:hypothetical protein